jgi:acyl carrier protein
MTISSRTPEGLPHRCPVCGKSCVLEPSSPGGDSCCPNCGHLLWWFRDRLSHGRGIAPEAISLSSSFSEDLGLDSLDVVELVMELEAEFDITIPDPDAERIVTLEDAIRYIEEQRRRRDDN